MDNLWSTLEQESIPIPEDLKLILSVTKYDNLFTLERFTKDDQKKIETFMQNTLHVIIKEEDREKYYGIFKDHPEKFMFVGGLERAMSEIINTAKKIAFKNIKTKNLVSAGALGSTSNAVKAHEKNSEKDSTKTVIDLKLTLDKNVNNYIQENYSGQDLPQISAKVAEDGLGCHIAELECPFPKCEKVTKITRIGNKWVTSNFYKHISMHSVKQKPTKKSNVTIDKMFNKLQEKNLNNNVSETATKGNDKENDQENDMKLSLKRKRIQTPDSSSGEDEKQSQSNEVTLQLENENEKSNFRNLEKMEEW